MLTVTQTRCRNKKLLSFTQESIVDLYSTLWIDSNNTRDDSQEKIYRSSQKHKWPFVRCFVHYKLEVKFIRSSNHTEQLLTYLITYLLSFFLTTWCRVFLEKLTGLQLVKKLPAFHGTRRFITALTRVRHLFLSWPNPIQSVYPHRTSWRSILILSTHLRLGLPSGFLPSGFPIKTLYTPLTSPIRATCPTHPIHRTLQKTKILSFTQKRDCTAAECIYNWRT